jgi:ATP-dependent exoDNAse (exonuclease V) beta subunit
MALRVYKASAGSGKTFTLVKEFLLLVLNNPDKYKRILAVTFTNKAANEMKERVVNALAKLANSLSTEKGEDALLDALLENSTLDESTIRFRSNLVLSSILHNYSDFAISTIDSFVYKLVRTFAHDLQLPYQFEVELNDEVVVSQAVEMLIDKVGSDAYVTKTLIGFLLQRMSDEGNWRIERDISRFCKYLLREDGYEQIRKLAQVDAEMLTEATNFLYAATRQFENELVPIARQALDLIHDYDLGPGDLTKGATGVYAFFDKLVMGDPSGAAANKAAIGVLESGKWASGNAQRNKAVLARLNLITHDLSEYLQYLMAKLHENIETYELRRELAKDMYSLAVMSELQQNMREIRLEENMVHISEFNKRIATLLSNVAVPYIYERLGERFQHYLIDEFQDTSVLQWHNFIPLIDNALANQYLTLVVGDAKQSIYRFRSGEVEQFMYLPGIYQKEINPMVAASEPNLKQHYDYKNLEFNFRSDGVIVNFNNDFFDFLLQHIPESFQSAYADHRQLIKKNQQSGFVQMRFLDKESLDDTDQGYLEQTYDLIVSQLEAGFAASDIAILVQKNLEGSKIARFLTEKGMEVVSADALLLDTSTKVRILINLLRLIQHHYEPVAITMVIHDLHSLYPDQAFDWQEHLQDIMLQPIEVRYDKFLEFLSMFDLSFSPRNYHALSLYDMVERLVRELSFDKIPDPYVQFFLEFVYEYQVKRQGSLADFLTHWNENKKDLSVVIPPGPDAIQVMTIHKAKGLEFPVVIFPFAKKSVRNTRKEFWVDLLPEEVPGLPVGIVKATKRLLVTRFASMYEEESAKSKVDMINVLYVVLTRASKRLYVVSELPGKTPGFNYQTFFKNFLVARNLWDEEQCVYEFGEEVNSRPTVVSTAAKPDAAETVFVSSDWTSKLRIAPDPVSQWVANPSGKAMYWGQLVHDILSEIRFIEDAPLILNKYFDEGTITKTQHDELEMVFKEMFDHEELAACFVPESSLFLERELITPAGKVYRPDRCVQFKGTTYILDYKTGQYEASHLEQIRKYKEALKDINNQPIIAYLVYLNETVELVKC